MITTVVNNNGGTAVAANFSAHVRQSGTEVTGSPQAGVGAPGTLYTLTAGTYAVTADGVSGYTPTGSGACSAAGAVTLTLGQNLTCTITVDDVAPTLRVITTVVNNSGGTAVAASFSAHVRQNGAEVDGQSAGRGGRAGHAVHAVGRHLRGHRRRRLGLRTDGIGRVQRRGGGDADAGPEPDVHDHGRRHRADVAGDHDGREQQRRDGRGGDFSAHVRQNGAEVGGSPQAGVGRTGDALHADGGDLRGDGRRCLGLRAGGFGRVQRGGVGDADAGPEPDVHDHGR